uniref:Uncharacterized protein n=1 Tax=Ditylenchus dipsaci TaxID=166011 RepID=A0A915DBF6_9BILA
MGIAIVELLRNEYDVPYVTKESFKVQFQPSIGISVDPDGTAKANESMVYLWTPNNNQSAFLSMRDLMYGKLAIRQKRAPKGGGGGGRGGGGGFRGGAGGGRGSSAARSASRAGMSSAGGASFGSGIGGVRPHVWLYVGSNSRAGYSYQNDEEYERDKDVDSTATRMEISLCFGKHKSRESCSAKVDAMMEKLSTEVSFSLFEKIQAG